MLNRRLLRLAAPVALGALALTACGWRRSDDTAADGGGKPTYKIAFQGPISGDNAAIGENEGNGVQLAIELANQKGDLPFTLAYSGQDDVGTPEGGPPAARKSIDDKQVMAVVGPAFSGATKSSGKLFAAAKLAAVSPSATNPTSPRRRTASRPSSASSRRTTRRARRPPTTSPRPSRPRPSTPSTTRPSTAWASPTSSTRRSRHRA